MVQFFQAHEPDWQADVQKAYDYLKANFPAGSLIRPDDVRQVLLPIKQTDERLGATLNTKHLTQKYWVGNFVDLVVDKTWPNIKK
jgi:hypothetical protein